MYDKISNSDTQYDKDTQEYNQGLCMTRSVIRSKDKI